MNFNEGFTIYLILLTQASNKFFFFILQNTNYKQTRMKLDRNCTNIFTLHYLISLISSITYRHCVQNIHEQNTRIIIGEPMWN